ncbi:MAG: hypothetical protein CM1200mP41_10110 [Gammaproteobacteria bacterium]|nr:MAG: hypothetical protein CM1200mP41_10110 [Gammaproteobacteria bacterium]
MMTGVECEYFLIDADGGDISDARDTQEKPCYDQSALMRRFDVNSEICDAMIDWAGALIRTIMKMRTGSLK